MLFRNLLNNNLSRTHLCKCMYCSSQVDMIYLRTFLNLYNNLTIHVLLFLSPIESYVK